jgi:rRNA maturation endonuclease Nob1
MLVEEQSPIICYECDAEFIVHSTYVDDTPVAFCPFCGSEVDDLEEEVDDDLFEDE